MGRARVLAAPGTRRVLGITGPPGSGKSTVAAAVLAALGSSAVVVPMDGFHLAGAELGRLGRADRKGAPDTFDAAGYAHLLERVKQETDIPVYVPGFDRTLEQPLAAALVVPPAARLVITEGNYLLLDDPLWARARRAIDAVWFVTSDENARIERLVARHIQFGKNPEEARAWVASTDQRNSDLVASTLRKADRVIVNGGADWSIA